MAMGLQYIKIRIDMKDIFNKEIIMVKASFNGLTELKYQHSIITAKDFKTHNFSIQDNQKQTQQGHSNNKKMFNSRKTKVYFMSTNKNSMFLIRSLEEMAFYNYFDI